MLTAQLRHRVTIERLVETQDTGDTGNVESAYETFAVVWARYRPMSVRELVLAGAEQSKIAAAFEIRPLSGVTRSMRIRFGAHLFNIEGVIEDATGNDYLTLPVSEITQ